MNNFNRWIRSKAGRTTIASVIVIMLVVAVIGQFAGWWGGPGTALPPVGQDCMPTCEENDGRMLLVVGSGGNQQTFAGENNIVWISVPEQYASFTLSVFDGDSGKDPSGQVNKTGGDWDTTIEEVKYVLYADPLKDGSTSKIVGQWSSNDMPDNAWYDIPIDNVQEAVGDKSDYYYRFEASISPTAYGSNSFKLKTENAYLSVGTSSLPGTSFGIIGMLYGLNDAKIIYPELASGNFDVTTYNGSWEFQFYLPEGSASVQFWNGDSDMGTATLVDSDSDDPNTVGKPDWAGPAAVDERAAGKGAPPDDSPSVAFRRSPSIQFTIIGPDGNEIARDINASGTEEWENFLVSTDPNADADLVVDSLPEGNYKLRIEGLDINNALWLRTDLELFHLPPPPPPPPPPCVPENSNLGGGYAIIALDPGSCQGQQNGLLFHGTSYTQLIGKAISNGCLRSVGTHDVLAAGVEYVGEYDNKNSKVKIIPDPYQVSTPVSVDVAAPNCSDPAAHQMDGKDFKGDVSLNPGLYCISGDVTINAGDHVKGDDVTLYFLDGKLTINGGSTVQLSAPYAPGVNVSPALSNILFYVPGAEGEGKPVTINGTSDSYFSGVVYAPGSEVEFLGTSYTEGAQTTQIIGWDVRVGGTADLILGYIGSDDPVCTIP